MITEAERIVTKLMAQPRHYRLALHLAGIEWAVWDQGMGSPAPKESYPCTPWPEFWKKNRKHFLAVACEKELEHR